MIGSDDFTSVTERSIVYRFNRGGVPVVHRLILNFSLLRVSASPIDGGSVCSLFRKCRPAGYFVFPT